MSMSGFKNMSKNLGLGGRVGNNMAFLYRTVWLDCRSLYLSI